MLCVQEARQGPRPGRETEAGMLEFVNLSKSYGGRKAVDSLSLRVNPGEIYGFIGHNGAGKTTAIKCCCGILRFEEGDALVDGLSIRDDPLACKRRFAYLPDNPDLYEFMTGAQYLGFVADVFGIGKREREERKNRLSDAFELTGDLGQPVSAYSHGMKQKLAVVGALLHEPRLLVMDEPFTGLDPKASFTLKRMMRELCDRGGAVFFSTHVLDVAERLCDKVAILRKGKLVAQGTMEAVKGQETLEEVFLELEADGA